MLGADPGFLDRGFMFTEGVRFVNVLTDYLLIFPDVSEYSP